MHTHVSTFPTLPFHPAWAKRTLLNPDSGQPGPFALEEFCSVGLAPTSGFQCANCDNVDLSDFLFWGLWFRSQRPRSEEPSWSPYQVQTLPTLKSLLVVCSHVHSRSVRGFHTGPSQPPGTRACCCFCSRCRTALPGTGRPRVWPPAAESASGW